MIEETSQYQPNSDISKVIDYGHSKVTGRIQITIPKKLRRDMGIEEGSYIMFFAGQPDFGLWAVTTPPRKKFRGESIFPSFFMILAI